MITAEIIQQTEARFAQRQPIRLEREAKINSGRILEADTPERVKSRLQHLATRAVVIEGVGLPAPGQPATTTADLERILGKNDLMSVRYLEIGLRIARTVGRIHIRSADGNRVRHRFPGVAQAADDQQPCPRKRPDRRHQPCRVQFPGRPRRPIAAIDLRRPRSRRPSSSPTGRSISAWSHSKATSATSAEFGWNGLSAAEGKLIVGEYVSIIQHPSGERKQLALRENQVVDVLDNFVHYRTDTSPGSSGSPVFNDGSGRSSPCTTPAFRRRIPRAASSLIRWRGVEPGAWAPTRSTGSPTKASASARSCGTSKGSRFPGRRRRCANSCSKARKAGPAAANPPNRSRSRVSRPAAVPTAGPCRCS